MDLGYKFNFDDDKCIIGHKKRYMPPMYVLMVRQSVFPIDILGFF